MRVDLKNGVIVRDTIVKDIEPVANAMRQVDRNEIWASHRHAPLEALTIAFYSSVLCYTLEQNGNPIVIFGVVPESFLGNRGSVWLLATDDFEKIHKILMKYSKQFIDYMLRHYPDLANHVDARNRVTLNWLKWCGAEIEEAQPFGVDKIPFHRFQFRRTITCATN